MLYIYKFQPWNQYNYNMNCPICDYKGLGDDALNCPSCNADLSVFRALDAVEESMQKQKKRTVLFIILFFIAMMACFAIYMIFTSGSDKANDEKLLACTAELQLVKAENQDLKTSLATAEEENKKLMEVKEEKEKNEPITHVIKDGESLYVIAREHLGNGDLWPKIAADNGIEDPDIIITGTELIINK